MDYYFCCFAVTYLAVYLVGYGSVYHAIQVYAADNCAELYVSLSMR